MNEKLQAWSPLCENNTEPKETLLKENKTKKKLKLKTHSCKNSASTAG